MPNTTLYIVSTPIGHLKDISIRAIETLKSVAFILCEDTRVSHKLMHVYDIKTPLRSFHDYTTPAQIQMILDEMKGLDVALISDAGTPLLHDPGFELVVAARSIGYTVTAIPGASSITNALVLSGVAPYPYTFHGFIPTKAKAKAEFIQKAVATPHTLVFFESVKRLSSTLTLVHQWAPTRLVSIMREMTKQFESVYQGTAEELMKIDIPAKGEVVMILGPQENQLQNPLELVDLFVARGMKPVDAIKEVAKSSSMTKAQLYEQYISR